MVTREPTRPKRKGKWRNDNDLTREETETRDVTRDGSPVERDKFARKRDLGTQAKEAHQTH